MKSVGLPVRHDAATAVLEAGLQQSVIRTGLSDAFGLPSPVATELGGLQLWSVVAVG